MRTHIPWLAGLAVTLALCPPALAQSKKDAKVFDPNEQCDRQYQIGLEYVKNARLIDAKDAFMAVAEACPERLNPHLQLGNIALQLKEYEQAIRHFDRALAIDSTNVEVQEAVAYALNATGKVEEAQARYLSLLRRDPNRSGALRNLAFSYEQQGRAEEAIMLYARAMEADSTVAPELEEKLAQLYLNQKAYDQALFYYRKLLDRNPDNLDVLGKVAYFHYKIKDYEGAVPLYEQLLQKDAQSANTLNYHKLLAFSLGKLGRNEEAVEHHEYILQAEPNEMNNYYQYGNLLIDIGRLDRAEELARAGLAKNSGWGCLHYLLGEIAEDRAAANQNAQKWDAARNLYKQAQGHFQSAVGDAQCGANATKQVERQAQLLERLAKLQEQAETTGALLREGE